MIKQGKRILAAALFCALALGVASASYAAPGKGGFQAQPYGQALTPEQQAQARQIFTENYVSLQNTREELAYKRQLLDQQLASPNPDSATIEKLSREIGELRGKMLAGRVAVRSQLEQQGLPPDCFGPCGDPGYAGPRYYHNGWGGGYHHGGRHGRGRGGCWGYGGMMGGW
ncbi:MAG: periplasmic heavy metal sensor [Desulfovibrio sp.]|nr:periplasmic heavy metal sensor [Desulfovibrio sp.]